MAGDPALAELYEAKAQTYAAFGNGAIAEHAERLLPPAGRVLDIGCASGGLLALLRPGRRTSPAWSCLRRPPAPRRRSPTRSSAARSRIRSCRSRRTPSISSCSPTCSSTSPIRPPGSRGRRRGVARAARSSSSVPNVAHWQARLTLLRGRWPQHDSGTFDAGHLRWFTRDALRALLGGAGLRDAELHAIVPALRNHVGPGRLADRAEPAWQALGRRAPGLLGYQLVGIGRRA